MEDTYSDDESPEEMAKMLALMRSMGRVGESTLSDLERQTQREVALRPPKDSPLLPRPTASRLLDVRDAALLQPPLWTTYNMSPCSISASRLQAQTEQQRNPVGLGGVGQFSSLDTAHPAWLAYVQRTQRSASFQIIDLFADTVAPTFSASSSSSSNNSSASSTVGVGGGAGVARGVRSNPFFQDDAPPLPSGVPPLSGMRSPRSASEEGLGWKSPRGDRSASVWEQEERQENTLLAVTMAQCRGVDRIMRERPKMVPHNCLLMIEIQLQQLALEGKCFHVAVVMEDVKTLESVFAQSVEQWNFNLDGVTSRIWVSQPSSSLQRTLMGSKHAAPGGLRLWRSVWRCRPSSSGHVLIEYLVASHPEPQRLRARHTSTPNNSSNRVEDDASARVVREGSTFFSSPTEAVLQIKATDTLLVVHTTEAVKLMSLASHQLLRTIPVSAKRVRIWGFHLFCICSDEPARVMVYDLVNENSPAMVLACPEVIPTEVQVRLLRGIPSVLVCGADKEVHVWHVPKRDGAPVPPLFSLEGHRDYVTCMEAHDDLVFTGSCDCMVGVWGDEGGPALQMLAGHTDWVFGLAVAAHSGLLSCSRDATIRLWSLTDKAHPCLRVISTSGSRALSLTLHSTSSSIAVALGNNRTAVIDLAALDTVRPIVLSGHAGRVTSLLFWRNCLVTASLDHSVRVWDLSSGSCVAVLRGHTDSVNSLIICNDELFSGGDDGSVLVWRLAELIGPPDTPRKSGGFKGLKFKSPSVAK